MAGLYGGHDDVFLFYRRMMALLEGHSPNKFQAVGSTEFARLATAAAPKR